MPLKISRWHLWYVIPDECLNVREWMEVVERNKDSPFPSLATMWIFNSKIKQMVLPRKHSKVLKKICTTDGTE